MRVLHVVPYISIDGAYGGPTSVALEQAKALRVQGHEVHLACGWDGLARVAETPWVSLYRARRIVPGHFGSLISLGLAFHVLRNRKQYDAIHVHTGRDLSILPLTLALAIASARVILQPHGMLTGETSRLREIYDSLITRRAIRRVSVVLTLTLSEEQELERISQGKPLRLRRVHNPAPATTLRAQWHSPSLVVFCSRLAKRKRPTVFVDAAAHLLARRDDVLFGIAGPDEGELAGVQSAIARTNTQGAVEYEGAIPPDAIQQYLAKAQVMVLPSVREPFPMIALEALSLGLPSVLTADTGISAKLDELGAAVIASDPSPESIAEAVESLLNEDRWSAVAERARRAATDEFSPAALATILTQVYSATSSTSSTPSRDL